LGDGFGDHRLKETDHPRAKSNFHQMKQLYREGSVLKPVKKDRA
jgi:hypothetical protein